MKIHIKKEIPIERISDLIADAWHASAYWATAERYIEPTAWHFGKRGQSEDYALNENGAVIIRDMEADEGDKSYGKDLVLDLASIERGLEIMAHKFPQHFADFLAENEDGDTADCFMQCTLLGDVIYG